MWARCSVARRAVLCRAHELPRRPPKRVHPNEPKSNPTTNRPTNRRTNRPTRPGFNQKTKRMSAIPSHQKLRTYHTTSFRRPRAHNSTSMRKFEQISAKNLPIHTINESPSDEPTNEPDILESISRLAQLCQLLTLACLAGGNSHDAH